MTLSKDVAPTKSDRPALADKYGDALHDPMPTALYLYNVPVGMKKV